MRFYSPQSAHLSQYYKLLHLSSRLFHTSPCPCFMLSSHIPAYQLPSVNVKLPDVPEECQSQQAAAKISLYNTSRHSPRLCLIGNMACCLQCHRPIHNHFMSCLKCNNQNPGTAVSLIQPDQITLLGSWQHILKPLPTLWPSCFTRHSHVSLVTHRPLLCR